MNKNRLSGIRKMLFALLATTLSVACSQEELADKGIALPEGKYPLELNVSGLEGIAVPSQASTRSTVDGDWKDKNIVAVQVGKEVKRYQAIPLSEDGKSAKLVAAEGETPFYWKRTDEKKYIDVWCPYSEINPDVYWWAVKTDQDADNGAGFRESDLIEASVDWLKFADRNDINVLFKHKVAKVIVAVKQNYVTDHLDFENATLTLSEFWNGNDKATIIAHKIDATGRGEACWEALVAPQNNNNYSSTFAITILGYDPFIYKRESSRDLQIKSGMVTTINVTLKGTQIEISSVECEPWVEGGQADGSTDEMVPR